MRAGTLTAVSYLCWEEAGHQDHHRNPSQAELQGGIPCCVGSCACCSSFFLFVTPDLQRALKGGRARSKKVVLPVENCRK